MAWPDEKAALVATIRRQEQQATALAKRFKLLQQTLQEQQKLLDRYHHALHAIQTNAQADSRRGTGKVETVSTVHPKECSSLVALSWRQKRTEDSSDLETVNRTPPGHIKKEGQEKKKKEIEKQASCEFAPKRASGELAATWAEEKQRMRKRSKWEHALEVSAPSANKENVGTLPSRLNSNTFAYVDVVRKRDERMALPAHDCGECTKYYDAVGELGLAEAAACKNKCSRHRATFEPYQTPDDFWRLSFPDSAPNSS